MPKKKSIPALQKPIKAAKRPKVDVKPTTINGIADPDAVAAMAPATIKVSPAKAARAHKGTVSSKSKKQKTIHPKAKITFRHNILPPLIGILAFGGVLGLLNAQWVSAQYQYYFTKPVSAASYSAQPTTTDPNAPAKLYIPKINVDAPIVTNQKSYSTTPVQLALRTGVLQYGASANPGQKGNIVIVGHSSGQLWAPGSYKFVFTLLNKLSKDDRIFIDYKGQRYIYRVSNEKVVQPTDITVLQPTDEPQLTLITCTPVGTSKNRLVITARQVSPKPETASAIDSSQIHPVTSNAIPN